MLLLWDLDEGLAQIDKYMDRRENTIVAGAFMALGLTNSGITNENDPVQAILIDKLETCREESLKIGALMGLSFTYAGSARADLLDVITPIILDSGNSTRLQAVAALTIGMIFVGTCDSDVSTSILQTLMDKEEDQLNDPFTRMFALGLGLLFLGQQAKSEASMEVCQLINNKKFVAFLELVVETCAYAGSGNVLKVQKMLHLCAEHKKEDKDSIHQIAAVIGVALIAFGETIGTDMCLRTMNHLLQYGEPTIRKTVPLAIGLLRVSNPDVKTLDLLNKLAYDSDAEVAMSAIFALGLVGAGTNNSKLAGNLRFLATYYQGEASQNQLFLVRISQGLVHMGKGLLGLNPFHSDKFLFSNVSLAGLMATIFAATDMSTFFCGQHHYFLYYLTLSMYPRMLITLNEKLEPHKCGVRVGNAIDTVGQAGKPRRITGFQTHETPVLIGHGERAEFDSEEFISTTSVLENFIIIQANPEYVAPDADKKKK
jgi:26S proteasome regulatory subunit N1